MSNFDHGWAFSKLFCLTPFYIIFHRNANIHVFFNKMQNYYDPTKDSTVIHMTNGVVVVGPSQLGSS